MVRGIKRQLGKNLTEEYRINSHCLNSEDPNQECQTSRLRKNVYFTLEVCILRVKSRKTTKTLLTLSLRIHTLLVYLDFAYPESYPSLEPSMSLICSSWHIKQPWLWCQQEHCQWFLIPYGASSVIRSDLDTNSYIFMLSNIAMGLRLLGNDFQTVLLSIFSLRGKVDYP